MTDSFIKSITKEFAPAGFKIKQYKPFSTPAGGPVGPIKKGDLAGQGVVASVYFAREVATNRKFAVRVTPSGHNTEIHSTLARFGIAPELFYQVELQHPDGRVLTVIIMDEISDTLENIINGPRMDVQRVGGALECILDKKYLLSILHGDFHGGNIVLLKDGNTLGLIDFDFSIMPVKPIVNVLDFIPLLTWLKLRANVNSIKLLNHLVKYYKDTFDMTIDKMKLVEKQGGGFEYADKNVIINSYFAIKSLARPISGIAKLFPNFKEPLID